MKSSLLGYRGPSIWRNADLLIHAHIREASIVEYIPWNVTLFHHKLRLMVRSFEQLQADLAENVLRERKRLRISQEQLALRAEVDRTYVSQIERGISNPSLLVLSKLSAVLQVDFLQLVAPRNDR